MKLKSVQYKDTNEGTESMKLKTKHSYLLTMPNVRLLGLRY